MNQIPHPSMTKTNSIAHKKDLFIAAITNEKSRVEPIPRWGLCFEGLFQLFGETRENSGNQFSLPFWETE